MKRFISVVVAAAILSGCSIEPPLYLRMSVLTDVQIFTEVKVNAMWQANWQSLWKADWNETTMGPLGYSDPCRMRMHIYTHGASGEIVSHFQHSFEGNTTELDLFVGTHNMLFYNLDSEAHLFKSQSELSDVFAYTRNISSGLRSSHPVYTMEQKVAGFQTKGDTEEEPVALAPESLFSEYHKDQVISDNPADYIYKDGRYILKIEGMLTPVTYIYLVQVKLLNNGSRVVGSNGGAAITGMAQGVNLVTKESMESTVSVPMDVNIDKPKDLLFAKVMSFGNPGCNPYNPASVADMPDQTHFFVLNVTYVNGSYRNIRVDITDQVRSLPLGGVITLELDVNDFPPEDKPGDGGGFDALIDNWSEETGETTITF